METISTASSHTTKSKWCVCALLLLILIVQIITLVAIRDDRKSQPLDWWGKSKRGSHNANVGGEGHVGISG